MAKRGKKYKKMQKDFDNKAYPLNEAIKQAKSTSYSSFPGTISVHLAVTLPKDTDPKSVKGSFSLPHPVKEATDTKIIVFCDEKEAEAAKKAGAVEAGLEKLVKKVQDGWADFDVVLATPAIMGQIAVLGRQLGPKGLMPNPKTGTLVDDIKKGIEEFKKGKSKFTCDEASVVHVPVGKVDTADDKIEENVNFIIKSVATTIGKPADSILRSVTLSPTMGAGVIVER